MRPLISLLALCAVALPATAQSAQPPAAESLFAIHFTTGAAWDAAKPPPEQKFFKEHSANLQRLRREGRLLIGARYADKGLIVVRAADETAVRRLLAGDPSLEAGVFSAQIDRFQPFMHGSTHSLQTTEAATIREFYSALNAGEAAKAVALTVPDVRWHLVASESSAVIEGFVQLNGHLSSERLAHPSRQYEVVTLDQAGAIMTVKIRATATVDSQRQRSEWVCVFEMQQGLIVRAWQFPTAPVR